MAEDDSDKSFISCSADDDQTIHEEVEDHGERSLMTDTKTADLLIGKLELRDEPVQPISDSQKVSNVNYKNLAVEDSLTNSVSEGISGDAPHDEKKILEEIEETTTTTESANKEHSDDKNHTDTKSVPHSAEKTQNADNNTYTYIPDASPSPTAAVSNGFVLPSAEARMAVLSRLRVYEAKRRPYYQGKLASSLLYWRSVCEMMSVSLEEMERIESLILGNIEMQKAMSEHCQGVVEDRIDVDGKLLDSKKAKKLQEEKRTRYNYLATFWKSNSDQITLSKLLGFAPPQQSPAINDDNKKLSQHSSSILRSVLDFHTSSADRFAENSALLREEAWLPLMTLRSKLEEQISLMEKMGGVIMTQLESAENTIQQAWCK